MKINIMKVFRQLIAIFIAVAIMNNGGKYMRSVLTFMELRGEMEFVEETAIKYRWTDELHERYNRSKDLIVHHQDPIVKWCYNCNTTAKVFTAGVLILMILAFLTVVAIIYIDVDFCKKRKKRRRHRMA